MDIREYLIREKLTLTEFGKISGISPTYLSRVIKGRNKLSKKTISLIFYATRGSVTAEDMENAPKIKGRIR